MGSTFQQPAIQSILPQLVPADQLVRANGWMQLLNGGAYLLGPVIGAALYAAFPLPVVLLSDVVGAALASLALAGVKIPPLVRQGDPTGGFWAEFQAGLGGVPPGPGPGPAGGRPGPVHVLLCPPCPPSTP